MPAGRKKKCRTLEFDVGCLECSCFGPVDLPKKTLKKLPQLCLFADELQTLIYQDIDGLTMQQGSKKMGISKTVYAGIYTQAKKKIVESIVNNSLLSITKN